MKRKAAKTAIDAMRSVSLVGIKATTKAIETLGELDSQGYREWLANAWHTLTDDGSKIARNALDPRRGWGLVRSTLSHDVKEATKKKYQTQLPWPQPSPVFFDGLAQTVLNVPETEVQEFLNVVVARYVRTLRSHWLDSAAYAWAHPGLIPMGDVEFGQLFQMSPASHFLNPVLDDRDKENFAEFLKKEGTYYKADLSALKDIPTLPGLYQAATVSLFEKTATGFVPLAIYIEDEVFTPKNIHAWNLAKFFVLQGAALCLLAGLHPLVHFPMDAINALTKSILPTDHPVRILLEPHLYMQLPLNYAVLYIDRSLAHNNQKEIYTPFSVPRESFFEIMRRFHQGMPGNSSYPGFKFSLADRPIYSPFQEFIHEYEMKVLDFVSEVIKTIKARDPHIRRWAHHLHQVVSGFPSADTIFQGDNLARTLMRFIANVSVVHSVDHHSYASVSPNLVPLRLRIPPPTSKNQAYVDPKDLVNWEDIFRHHMAWEMYFKPSTVKRLVDTDYPFTDDALKERVREFHASLRALDAELENQRFIPLEDIASSIQY